MGTKRLHRNPNKRAAARKKRLIKKAVAKGVLPLTAKRKHKLSATECIANIKVGMMAKAKAQADVVAAAEEAMAVASGPDTTLAKAAQATRDALTPHEREVLDSRFSSATSSKEQAFLDRMKAPVGTPEPEPTQDQQAAQDACALDHE